MPKGRPFTLADVLAEECCGPDCHSEAEPEYPIPICARHIVAVIRTYQAQATTIAGRPQEIVVNGPDVGRKIRDHRTHVVYFLRFGDRVKIGTTTDPEGRFRVLPHDEVIGMIPGDAKVERLWHTVWADIRVNGEWFTATDELLAAVGQAIAEAA